MSRSVNRITLVWAADSGLAALLVDVVKKAVGRDECALCEITYSPVGKRRAWAACERRLGVDVDEMYRDRVPASWGIAPSEVPVIVGHRGDEPPFVLVSRAEIEACHGSVDELERRIRRALDAGAAGDDVRP